MGPGGYWLAFVGIGWYWWVLVGVRLALAGIGCYSWVLVVTGEYGWVLLGIGWAHQARNSHNPVGLFCAASRLAGIGLSPAQRCPELKLGINWALSSSHGEFSLACWFCPPARLWVGVGGYWLVLVGIGGY